MKNYLSFGGGVNSVALYLLLLEQGLEPGNAETGFEAVYVWMPDWPETHEYRVMMEGRGYPITTIFPSVEGDFNLYDYCAKRSMTPSFRFRWCTGKFKITTIQKYYQKPCFNNMGISFEESHRAILRHVKGIENRFPFIEHEIDREGCVALIKRHGLPVPMKSGCFICPFQKRRQWQELRRVHPELFSRPLN